MNSEHLALCLVALLGCGSWVAVNGIWSESPVLWPLAPECLHLASIMTVTVQLANIGPILYFVGRTLCKGKGVEVQTWAIYIMYLLGIASCSLLAGLWNRTSDVLGEQHSTALISLLFFLALLDCTSTVTFIPFMAQFPKHYLSALYIGEGWHQTVINYIINLYMHYCTCMKIEETSHA
jgi:riboflavin transporter 2